LRFQALSLRCECGLAPLRIKQVGLTAEHQLVIHWRCSGCKRQIYAVKDLNDCWHECPSPDDQQEVCNADAEKMCEPDVEFLHSLGVRLPDIEPS
jgi:hypothetical protein